MRVPFYRRPTFLPLASVLILLPLALGCGSREQITSYTVPKETKATPPAAAPSPETTAEAGEATHRMLAAILPAGNQAWFFKVVGPLEAIEKRAEEINKFFAGIRLAEDGRPKWELPAADWKEEQGTGMRAATIRIPTGGESLELSVIGLPWRGTPDDLLSNVNRWRGQMKLSAASQEQLPEFTREIKSEDGAMTIVDLRGRFDGGSAMMPPFAGGAQGPRGQVPALPPGHPPIHGAPDGDR